jgi:secreted trypsin-like serine protease
VVIKCFFVIKHFSNSFLFVFLASSGQSSLPRQAKLQVDPVDIKACASVLPPQLPLTEAQVCTSSLNGADVCTGDFGGPLVKEIDGVFYLAAISSYNTECGDPSVPTVHSRVDYHSAWIQGASIDAIQCGTPQKMKKRGKLL